MGQVKWFDRKFDFEKQQNIFPSVIERLAGTPARLEEKLKMIPIDFVTVKKNNTWSIQENVGHLVDLEPLWQGRLLDILNGEKELRATDLLNQQTDLANHNGKPLQDILLSFRKIRMQTLGMLDEVSENMIFKSALHPRLKTPMRTIDLFLFVAEHDDHHLARITELVKIFTIKGK